MATGAGNYSLFWIAGTRILQIFAMTGDLRLPKRRPAARRVAEAVALDAANGCCVTVAVRRPCAGPEHGLSRMPAMGLESGAVHALKMSQQPESSSPQPVVSPAAQPGAAALPDQAPGKLAPQRIPRWLERSELFLRVLLRMYIGLAVCYVPWSKTFWDQNPLFVQFPTLSIYAANGAVRGLVSGLGLLNLWIAFYHALHYRDG